jgi:hypothetical protein
MPHRGSQATDMRVFPLNKPNEVKILFEVLFLSLIGLILALGSTVRKPILGL